MNLVEVEGVDPLLSPYQNGLVVRLRVDPRRRAMDLQRTTVEHLERKMKICQTASIINEIMLQGQ